MKSLSGSSLPLRARLLASGADALSVPVALLMSLGIHANGVPTVPVSSMSLVTVACMMLCIALSSFLLGRHFAHPPGLFGSTVGVRLVLSGLLMAMIFAPVQQIGAPMTPIVCALSFFVVSTLGHALLGHGRHAGNDIGMKLGKEDRRMRRAGHLQTPSWPPANPSELLGRDELTSQMNATKAYADRVVLISGAGGSIGSELSHQVLVCRPRKIILFELSESALYQVHQSMLNAAAGTNIEVLPVLGSVTDERKVKRTLQEHGVQVVLHAAAYKHVPLVELNPLAGLHNNVVGTQILAMQSMASGVERFVLVSSDKAVRPINVMGASKRLCELIVRDIVRGLAGKTGPVFSIVRFGNVLGSSGSVLPLFYDQVCRGGPITVTHPDVSRFFMTAREAVQLVLHAGSLAHGGEVFVLDMGQPVKIKNLARRVIQSAGLQVRDQDQPGGDIEIKFIGLRRGEKLTEELTFDGRRVATSHPKIFKTIETGLSEFEVAAAWRALRQALANDDEAGAREYACQWVSGFGETENGAPPDQQSVDMAALNLCQTDTPNSLSGTDTGRP